MRTHHNKATDRDQLDSDLNDVVEAMWALNDKGTLTHDEKEQLKSLTATHESIVDALGQ